MKLKPASVVLLFASALMLSGVLFFYHQKQERLKAEITEELQIRAQKIARRIDLFLHEKIESVRHLSSVNIILKQLHHSNQVLAELDEKERNRQIAHLNAYWIATTDERDPFITSYTDNSVAQYLMGVAANNLDEFGEIFITNRYGVVIATTNKLTTLAHANKYWWKAAYDSGKGRVFLDDRGFDQSVKGYVIGVVMPIKEGDEVIGIVKINFNVLGGLTHALWPIQSEDNAEVILARSGGLAILEKGKPPLSSLVPVTLSANMNPLITESREVSFAKSEGGDKKQWIVANSPVRVSFGSEAVGFGGAYRSADHYKGNNGETWLVLVMCGHKAE